MTDVQNKAPEKKEDRRVRRKKKMLRQGPIPLMQEKKGKGIKGGGLARLVGGKRGAFHLSYPGIFYMLGFLY